MYAPWLNMFDGFMSMRVRLAVSCERRVAVGEYTATGKTPSRVVTPEEGERQDRKIDRERARKRARDQPQSEEVGAHQAKATWDAGDLALQP